MRVGLPSPLLPSFESDRSWTFDVPVGLLWERLTSVDEYTTWWPWLAEFEPVGGFRRGASWRCTVEPPLPYRVRFRIELDEVRAPAVVRARVTGDIRGDAVLTVDSTGDRSTARLHSSLSPANPLLRTVGVAAGPLIAWGHDWVLDSGRRQFIDRALESR